MDPEKTQHQQPKGEGRFSREQYDILLRYSKKKDMSEWRSLTGLTG